MGRSKVFVETVLRRGVSEAESVTRPAVSRASYVRFKKVRRV